MILPHPEVQKRPAGPALPAPSKLTRAGAYERMASPVRLSRRARPAGPLKQDGGTHADENETSMMLYIAPEIVDMSKAVKDLDLRPGRRGLTRDPRGPGTFSPTGIYGDPTLATREKGRIIVEATVREIVRQVRELIGS